MDEFVSLMGYNRNYASWLLRNIGRKVAINGKRSRIILVGEQQKIKGREVGKYMGKKWRKRRRDICSDIKHNRYFYWVDRDNMC